MIRLPRLALATPGAGPEPAAASVALLAGLAEERWRVQHFASRARPTRVERVGQVTGRPGRHLDAWLMPPDVCRAVFARGVRDADLAIVEGTLDPHGSGPGLVAEERPGPLGPLAESLDLPCVALLDCRDVEPFHLPHLPRAPDGVILDGLSRREAFEPLRRMVEALLKRPVVGAVEDLPECRAALAAEPAGRPVAPEVVGRLGASFLRFADLEALRALAESRPAPAPSEDVPALGAGGPFRVAYAMDAAFGGYFPDTLETLEALGAELVEFSPLRDEALPGGVDLVMIGCGYPDRYADELAANLSLIAELRAHVCRGGRVYSEGGGTAYLGRQMLLGDRAVPGAGIFPIDAERVPDAFGPAPVCRILARDGWLGPRGTMVRGYLSPRWRLRPAPEPGDCPARSGVLTESGEIVFRKNAVGSLIHLHLAALPQAVSAFAGPHRPSLVPPAGRRAWGPGGEK